MKRLKYLYAGTFLLFALLLVIANILQKNREEQSNQGRNVVMNRIAGLVETEMKASGANPEEIVQLCFYDKKDTFFDFGFGLGSYKVLQNPSKSV